MPTPDIPDKPFYKLAEVCQITDTQPYVLRFWESEFPQLAPQKNRTGQRVYSRKELDLVLRIKKLLYEEEYTIAGVRDLISREESGEGESSAARARGKGAKKAARAADREEVPRIEPEPEEPPADEPPREEPPREEPPAEEPPAPGPLFEAVAEIGVPAAAAAQDEVATIPDSPARTADAGRVEVPEPSYPPPSVNILSGPTATVVPDAPPPPPSPAASAASHEDPRRLDALTRTLEETRADRQRLIAELDRAREERAEAFAERDAAAAERDAAAATVSDLAAARDAAAAERDEAHARLLEVTAARDDAYDEARLLQAEIDTHKRLLQEARAEAARAAEEARSLEASRDRAQQTLDARDAEAEELRATVEEIRAERDRARQEVEVLRDRNRRAADLLQDLLDGLPGQRASS